MTVQFHYQAKVNIRDRNKLRCFLLEIFQIENTQVQDLQIVFCDDQYLLDINKSFLNHNYFTDIITFDLSDSKTSPKIGEIYISIDTVKEHAVLYNTTTYKELHRVIFHGVLHLCGYKDKSKKDFNLMKQKEDYYLSLYFI